MSLALVARLTSYTPGMDGEKKIEFSKPPRRVSPDLGTCMSVSTSSMNTIGGAYLSSSSTTTTATTSLNSSDFALPSAASLTSTSNLIPVTILSATAAANISTAPVSITHQTILNTPTITLSNNPLTCDSRTLSSYSAKHSSSTMVQSNSTTPSVLCTNSSRSTPSIASVTLLSSNTSYPSSDGNNFSDQDTAAVSAPQSSSAHDAPAFQSTTATGITLNAADTIVSIQTNSADIHNTAAPSSSSTPSLPSTMHVPRGAAVAAQISNRSSQAISANATQRASLPNRGIHLAPGSWSSRTSNTIITCSTTSNASSLITSVATTTATISTSKFTRFPLTGPTGIARAPASLASTSMVRTAPYTRVISTSSIVHGGSSTSSTTTPVPCTTIGSSQGVQGVAVVAPSARAVLTQTRTPGTIRPPTLSTISQPIRLSQSTLASPQRPPAAYNLSSGQRPSQPHSVTGPGNIRARTTANPRLSTQSVPSSQSNINLPHLARGSLTSTNTAPSSTSSTAVHAPARPQSNPGLSSTTVRPPQSGSRPASTGPIPVASSLPAAAVRPVAAVHTASAIRPAGIVRGGFTGSHSTTFIRAESGIGLRGVPSVSMEGKSGNSQTRLQHTTQQQHFLHMVNAPAVQKASSNGASSSVIGGSVSIIGGRAPNNPGAGGGPSIAVRISSSPAGAVAGMAQPTTGSLAQGTTGTSVAGRLNRQAELQTTLIVPAGGKGTNVATASSAATAAAAVLPAGTTITPTILSTPTHPRTDPPPAAQTSVFLHKGPPPAGVTGGSGQYNLGSQSHYFVDNKQASSVTVGSGRISSSGGPAASRRQGDIAPQQQAPVGGSPASKPTASPRPSILRKRQDYDSAGSSKACKNLTGALSASGGRSSSPPSPKGTDSGGGNSGASTGSATLSANSSPGLLIEEGESGEEPRPTPPVIASLPDGISPRKKPRKQQLTGNELLDAQHSSDEEDDRPPRQAKRTKRDAEYEEELDNINWSGDAPIAQSRNSSLSSRSSRTFHPSRSSAHSASNNSKLVSPRSALNARNPNSENVGHAKNTHVLAPLPHHGSDNWSDGAGNQGPSDNHASTSTAGNNNTVANTNVNSENEFVERGRRSRPQRAENDETNSGPRKMRLMRFDGKSYKSRACHFERHSQVNVKPERIKVATFSDGKKKKLMLQKLEGWKVFHVSGQVSDMVKTEKEVSSRLGAILNILEAPNKSPRQCAYFKDVDPICELVKANVQRSKIIHDQMNEAQCQMTKLVSHKSKVAQIMTKFSSKRQLRKKEKK